MKRERHDWGSFVQLFTYDEWKPIVEYDGGGNFVAWNIYGPGADEILYRSDVRVGDLRYQTDKQGNVTALLDYYGSGIEKYSYDAFGRPSVSDWSGANARTWSNYLNAFMFTGREYFPGLWLYDYRHRWYDPQLGRFLQSDPTGFDADDMNLFRYCADDPVDKSDPTGLMGLDFFFAAFLTTSQNLIALEQQRQQQPAGNQNLNTGQVSEASRVPRQGSARVTWKPRGSRGNQKGSG